MISKSTVIEIRSRQRLKQGLFETDILRSKWYRRIKTLAKYFMIILTVFSHYNVAALIHGYIHSPFFYLSGMHIYLLISFVTLLMIYWFLFRHRSLKTHLEEILKDASLNNPKQLKFRLKIVSVFAIIWSISFLVDLITTSYLFFTLEPEFRRIVEYSAFFGYQLPKTLASTISFFFVVLANLSIFGAPITFTMLFNFTITTASDSLDSIRKLLDDLKTSNNDLDFVRAVDKVLTRIEFSRRVFGNINRDFKYALLAWFSGTLLSSCLGTTWLVDTMDRMNIMGIAHFVPIFFLTVSLLCNVVIKGSGINSKLDTLALQLNSLSSTALVKNKCSEMLLIRAQLESPTINITVGGCIPIKRKILLTFVALAITYIVVFLQFNPSALTKIQEKLRKA